MAEAWPDMALNLDTDGGERLYGDELCFGGHQVVLAPAYLVGCVLGMCALVYGPLLPEVPHGTSPELTSTSTSLHLSPPYPTSPRFSSPDLT